ncbi:hypothetical protein PSYMO_38473, partial [Pseudomonas amygdali pv. mori str. 301020]
GRRFGPIAVEGEIAPTTIARLHLDRIPDETTIL